MATANVTSTVLSYPRIHMCLIDLGRATGRAYGGAGFSITAHPTIIQATSAAADLIVLPAHLDQRAEEQVYTLLERLRAQSDFPPTQISVLASPPQHKGLGSKTTMLLAILAALRNLYALPLSDHYLRTLSHRGGASGIGINTFFTGGFVVDDGHPQQEVPDLLPSSARSAASLPNVSVQLSFPSDWHIYLLESPNVGMSGAGEIEFFRRVTPLSSQAVHDTLACVYHSLVPAVARGDIQGLRSATSTLSQVGFKAAEIAAQSNETKDALQECSAIGSVAAGLSSIGPTIYAIAERSNVQVRERLLAISRQNDFRLSGPFLGCNFGHHVESR